MPVIPNGPYERHPRITASVRRYLRAQASLASKAVPPERRHKFNSETARAASLAGWRNRRAREQGGAVPDNT